MTTPDPICRVVSRAHRMLLALYPAEFRRRFGDDMQRVFETRLIAARASGRYRAAMFAVLELGDVVRGGLLERMAPVAMEPAAMPLAGRTRTMTWDATQGDVRHSLRLMRRAPLFTAMAMGAFALGIGAASAIFAAVHGVLLRPLPYDRPADLVMVWSNNTHESHPHNPVSPADYLDLRSMTRSFAGVEAMQSFLAPGQFRNGGDPVPIQSSYVTPGMLSLLGRQPIAGRLFQPGDRDVIVLSHALWQRAFGGDRAAIGRTIDLNQVPTKIVGVMPADFVFPYRTMLGPSGFSRAQSADLYEVMQFEGRFFRNADGTVVRQARFLSVVGRLAAGSTPDQARADVSTVTASLARAYPSSNEGWDASLVSLHEQTVSTARPALLLLFAGVGLVWLIACANVANLLLARGVARRNERAIRRALGASGWRLGRQTFVEGFLLSMGGAAGAAVLLYAGMPVLVAMAPADTPRLEAIVPDATVWLFTIGLAVLSGVLSALLPAVAAAGTGSRGALKDAGRGTTAGPSSRRARASLVIAEVALAVLLATGATLLVRSFVSLLDVDPGFSVDRLLTFQINAPTRLTDNAARVAYYDDLFARLDAIPGVTASGGTTRLPLGSTNVSTLVAIEGRDVAAARLPEVEFRRALHDYFGAMGIPVVRGRGFTHDDGPDAAGVCVINQAMDQRLFKGEDAVGHRVRLGTDPRASWLTIVGIVGDVRHGSLEEVPRAELYISARQGPPVAPYIAVRASGSAISLAEAVRSAVRAADPATPIFDLRTMADIRGDSVSARRFVLTIAGVFGVLALLLAVCGVYGVMALIVSERTSEVGLRVALGATRSDILGLVVGQAARLGLAGVALGTAGAVLAAPLMASQLFGVRPLDAITFVSVPLIMMGAAVAAALGPARRAMRVDPVIALRGQ